MQTKWKMVMEGVEMKVFPNKKLSNDRSRIIYQTHHRCLLFIHIFPALKSVSLSKKNNFPEFTPFAFFKFKSVPVLPLTTISSNRRKISRTNKVKTKKKKQQLKIPLARLDQHIQKDKTLVSCTKI